jgi:hypothetical protein
MAQMRTSASVLSTLVRGDPLARGPGHDFRPLARRNEHRLQAADPSLEEARADAPGDEREGDTQPRLADGHRHPDQMGPDIRVEPLDHPGAHGDQRDWASSSAGKATSRRSFNARRPPGRS